MKRIQWAGFSQGIELGSCHRPGRIVIGCSGQTGRNRQPAARSATVDLIVDGIQIAVITGSQTQDRIRIVESARRRRIDDDGRIAQFDWKSIGVAIGTTIGEFVLSRKSR